MRRFLLATASVSALALSAGAVGQSSTTSYSYDALGRLITAQTTGGANNAKARALCYDSAGNRTRFQSGTSGTLASCAAPAPTPTPSPSPSPTPTPTPAPSFAIGNAAGLEGDTLAFTVTKTGSTSSTYTVNYATAYGTAGSGDFYATSGTLSFAANETVKYINVLTKTDPLTENTETFSVNLTAPSGGATITDSQALGQIFDDSSGGGMCGDYFC